MSELVTAAAALTQAVIDMKEAKESFENVREDTSTQVNGLLDDAEIRINAKEIEVDDYLNSAKGTQVLPMPLNLNCAFLGSSEEERLQGWGVTGGISIETVHPFEKGFEGPYTEVQETKNAFAPDISSATESTPYFFGRYNKGPRAKRGGLADGWMAMSNGKLLKVTKQAGKAHRYSNSIILTMPQNVKSTHIHMRGFIYTEYDTQIYVGRLDSGARLEVPKGEWMYIDHRFNTSEVFNNLIYINFISSNYSEVYFALPSFYVEANSGDDMSFITRS